MRAWVKTSAIKKYSSPYGDKPWAQFWHGDSAQYNMEQLIHGISNDHRQQAYYPSKKNPTCRSTIKKANDSYRKLMRHWKVTRIFSVSRMWARLSFTARQILPAAQQTGNSGGTTMKDLRAIPFVSAWSQIKTKCYGILWCGYRTGKLDKEGKFTQAKELYSNSSILKPDG